MEEGTSIVTLKRSIMVEVFRDKDDSFVTDVKALVGRTLKTDEGYIVYTLTAWTAGPNKYEHWVGTPQISMIEAFKETKTRYSDESTIDRFADNLQARPIKIPASNVDSISGRIFTS